MPDWPLSQSLQNLDGLTRGTHLSNVSNVTNVNIIVSEHCQETMVTAACSHIRGCSYSSRILKEKVMLYFALQYYLRQ